MESGPDELGRPAPGRRNTPRHTARIPPVVDNTESGSDETRPGAAGNDPPTTHTKTKTPCATVAGRSDRAGGTQAAGKGRRAGTTARASPS